MQRSVSFTSYAFASFLYNLGMGVVLKYGDDGLLVDTKKYLPSFSKGDLHNVRVKTANIVSALYEEGLSSRKLHDFLKEQSATFRRHFTISLPG